MGVKRIILIGMLFPLLFSCREEYISDGEHRTEMFVIINSTSQPRLLQGLCLSLLIMKISLSVLLKWELM